MIVIEDLRRAISETQFLPLEVGGEFETFLSEQIKGFLASQWGVDCQVVIKKSG